MTGRRVDDGGTMTGASVTGAFIVFNGVVAGAQVNVVVDGTGVVVGAQVIVVVIGCGVVTCA